MDSGPDAVDHRVLFVLRGLAAVQQRADGPGAGGEDDAGAAVEVCPARQGDLEAELGIGIDPVFAVPLRHRRVVDDGHRHRELRRTRREEGQARADADADLVGDGEQDAGRKAVGDADRDLADGEIRHADGGGHRHLAGRGEEIPVRSGGLCRVRTEGENDHDPGHRLPPHPIVLQCAYRQAVRRGGRCEWAAASTRVQLSARSAPLPSPSAVWQGPC